MSKVILANIGNRNIIYKGKSFPDQKDNIPDMSFRSFTLWLLENFDKEKQQIQPAILPVLFDAVGISAIQKLILFYSDIQGGDRNDQDTIYEADLLEKIIRENHPHLLIEKKAIHCSVVDNDRLMHAYRNHLIEILDAEPEAFFIVCDAGGTAQQKAALKILVEFLIPQDRFETYNVLQKGKSTVEKISSYEYRKVINQEQIRSLIRKFNYEAAYELYNMHNEKSDVLETFLKVIWLLFANEVKAAVSLSRLPVARDQPEIKIISVKSHYLNELPEWQNLIKKDGHFELCLLLDIAASYQKRQDKGFTILFHHIFLERFCSEIINALLPGKKNIDEASDWQWLKQKLLTKELFPKYVPPFKLEGANYASFPIKLGLVESLADEKINSIVDAIPANKQQTFSNLRNKFAHEGKSISDDNIKTFIPVFRKWREQFQLHPSETIFDKFNQSILTMLK